MTDFKQGDKIWYDAGCIICPAVVMEVGQICVVRILNEGECRERTVNDFQLLGMRTDHIEALDGPLTPPAQAD